MPRKKGSAQNGHSSSSSSTEMQNDSTTSGIMDSDNCWNKRQNNDNTEQSSKPKRTCISDQCCGSPGHRYNTRRAAVSTLIQKYRQSGSSADLLSNKEKEEQGNSIADEEDSHLPIKINKNFKSYGHGSGTYKGHCSCHSMSLRGNSSKKLGKKHLVCNPHIQHHHEEESASSDLTKLIKDVASVIAEDDDEEDVAADMAIASIPMPSDWEESIGTDWENVQKCLQKYKQLAPLQLPSLSNLPEVSKMLPQLPNPFALLPSFLSSASALWKPPSPIDADTPSISASLGSDFLFPSFGGRFKPRALPESDINRLPTRKYTMPNSASSSGSSKNEPKKTDSNKVCWVCHADYENGDDLRILPCSHEFHIVCLDPWLKVESTCPTCRATVTLAA